MFMSKRQFLSAIIGIFVTGSLSFSSCATHLDDRIFEGGDTGRAIFIDALKKAQGSVWVGAFKLHRNLAPHPEILEALSFLSKEKIPVQVILESRLSDAEIKGFKDLPKGTSLQAFQETGSSILSDLKPFTNVHLKIFADERSAIISTTNYDDTASDHIKRDFSFMTYDTCLVSELNDILNKIKTQASIDWPSYHLQDILPEETRLAWGPRLHKLLLEELIANAHDEIVIYQQSLQDEDIFKALQKKSQEGVKIRILMSQYPFGKHYPNKSLSNLQELEKSGAQFRLTGDKIVEEGLPLHIHAKVIIVDPEDSNRCMYLGSANFYAPVLAPQGDHLNVGIITKSKKHILDINSTFEADWKAH